MKSPVWINLNESRSDEELPEIPAEYWYLQIFEVVLRLENEAFLVLEFPFYSYGDVVNNLIHECMWSPPYTANKVEVGARRHIKVGQIQSVFKEFEVANKALLDQMREHKLYTMGIGDCEMIDHGSLLEYKVSQREPNKKKCYFVKRIGLKNLDSFGLYNIVDPEALKSYAYLPLDINRETISADCFDNLYFKGKPLATNTCFLFNSNKIRGLENTANEISADYLSYSERGMLFSFDLIAFGKGQEIITDTFQSLRRRGGDIAEEFEFILNSEMGVSLFANQYTQVRLMGDGFIAASPIRQDNSFGLVEESDIIRKQILNTLKIIREIFSKIRRKAPNVDFPLSCRASLMFGDYKYGKLAGLIHDRADLGGACVLKSARLMSLIESWFLVSNGKREGVAYLAVEADFFDRYRDSFDSLAVHSFSGTAKELECEIVVVEVEF
jgi:hypothetical protein